MKAVGLLVGVIAMAQVSAGAPSGQLTNQVPKGKAATGIGMIQAAPAGTPATVARNQRKVPARESYQSSPVQKKTRTEATAEETVKPNGLIELLRVVWFALCVLVLYKLTKAIWCAWGRWVYSR